MDEQRLVEARNAINSAETREVTDLLESLDEKSKVLAKTYLSALVDRQQLEKSRLAVAAV